MTALWTIIRPHFFWIVVVVGGVMSFRVYLAEHDARVRAEFKDAQDLKDSAAQIATLREQIASRQVETQKQVQVVVKEVQAAKTPEQQVAEIPKLQTEPLNAQPLPDAPSDVKVALLPLLAQLSECKTDSIKLASCQQEAADRLQLEQQQDKTVSLLKKERPGWFRRTFTNSKFLLWGGAIGAGTVVIVEAQKKSR